MAETEMRKPGSLNILVVEFLRLEIRGVDSSIGDPGRLRPRI